MTWLWTLLACTWGAPEPTTSAAAPARGNVLIVLLDDIGVDKTSAYDVGLRPPPTPTLERLAKEGVLFRNAYANPSCSATRATLLTGQHAMRHGFGRALSVKEPPLSPQTWTLAEALRHAGHGTAVIGKWHLGPPPGPGDHGFDHVAVSTGNLVLGASRGYSQWWRVEDGVGALTTTYATTDSVDSTLAYIDRATEPWFVYLALHAAHAPFHVPPNHLHPFRFDGRPSDADKFDAMVSAADHELGRLVAALDAREDETTIFVMGDNGTPGVAVRPPQDAERAKATHFEGGIRVPLIVRGPVVQDPGRTTDALVSVVDLYPTVLEVAGVSWPEPLVDKLDGVSFLPVLSSPGSRGPRRWMYTEGFEPNFGPVEGRTHWRRVVRDARWKLVRSENGVEFISEQGNETSDVGPETRPLRPEARRARARLSRVLDGELAAEDPRLRLTQREALAALGER